MENNPKNQRFNRPIDGLRKAHDIEHKAEVLFIVDGDFKDAITEKQVTAIRQVLLDALAGLTENINECTKVILQIEVRPVHSVNELRYLDNESKQIN